MKTIKRQLKKQLWVASLVAASIFIFTACENETEIESDVLTDQEEEVAVSEAEIDAVFEDVDDMSTTSIQSLETSEGGKLAEEPDDDRFCDGVFSFEGDKTSGTITLDFGEGCVDRNGNVRMGKIIIAYEGGRLMPGAKVTTTLVDYSINSIAIEGVRTLENISETIEDYPTFHITLEDGKVTWPDETMATREVDKVRVWVNASNPVNDEFHITGEASGTNRRNVDYEVAITDTLVYKRNCRISRRNWIPVAGTKVIETNNKIMTIDFGDGECDRRIEVIVEGKGEEVTVD